VSLYKLVGGRLSVFKRLTNTLAVQLSDTNVDFIDGIFLNEYRPALNTDV
jgi:hypothetical protein